MQSTKVGPPGLRAREKIVGHASGAHKVYTRMQEGQKSKSRLLCLIHCFYVFIYHTHCKNLVNICLMNEFPDESGKRLSILTFGSRALVALEPSHRLYLLPAHSTIHHSWLGWQRNSAARGFFHNNKPFCVKCKDSYVETLRT